MRNGSSGSEGGRRRAIGVVATLQSPPRATAPMVRRWAAEGGPEGRGRENQGHLQLSEKAAAISHSDPGQRPGSIHFRSNNQRKNGAPKNAVITPTGSSAGATMVLAATSQRTRKTPPKTADIGNNRR